MSEKFPRDKNAYTIIYVIITPSLNVRAVIILDIAKISTSTITQQLKFSKALNLTRQNFFNYKNLLSNNSHNISYKNLL